MPPHFSSLQLVGDGDSARAAVVRAAVNELQPTARIHSAATLDAALGTPAVTAEVLVLLEPKMDGLRTALAARDARGLPRWAVVPPLVEDAEDAGSSADADAWKLCAVKRSIRLAVMLLALRRDNARLGGDLHTVARRLAHDLRTPLNSISTANEALPELAASTPGSADFHHAISAAVDEMTGLLDRTGTVLMASARPTALESVDIEAIVWTAREKLDARIRSARATVVAPAKWPVVNGVAAWLEVVWTNLLANALQHGGPNPRIELGWERSDGGQVRFWIRDSGAGVVPAKRGQLFHPFDRLHAFSAPRGYGLSLVQRLIELQGGTTGYATDPTPGGCFYFTLPEQT